MIEPFGSLENDRQQSYNRLVTQMSFGGGKKGKKPKQEDFSLFAQREKAFEQRVKSKSGKVVKQSTEEMREILYSIASASKKGRRK